MNMGYILIRECIWCIVIEYIIFRIINLIDRSVSLLVIRIDTEITGVLVIILKLQSKRCILLILIYYVYLLTNYQFSVQIYIMNFQNHHKDIYRIKQYLYHKNHIINQSKLYTVYKGINLHHHHQQVAIKKINLKLLDNQATQYLFNNQKKVITHLKHPNILSALDIITQNDHSYIITQYQDASTLQQILIKKIKYEEKQALQLFKDILQGYKACVQFGILHRNLKPSSICFYQGIVKISEFQFCDLKNQVKPKMFYTVGQSIYTAPQAYLNNLYSQKSDIWSLGLIFYEMITGNRISKNNKNPFNLLNQIKNQDFLNDCDISQNSKSIIKGCLCLNIKNRMNADEVYIKVKKNMKNKKKSNDFPLLIYLKDHHRQQNWFDSKVILQNDQKQFDDTNNKNITNLHKKEYKLMKIKRLYKSVQNKEQKIESQRQKQGLRQEFYMTHRYNIKKQQKKKPILNLTTNGFKKQIKTNSFDFNNHSVKLMAKTSDLGRTSLFPLSSLIIPQSNYLRMHSPQFKPIPVLNFKFSNS